MRTEHPILFNSEMVRAILDDRKRQTRRVVKPQPTGGIIIPDHLVEKCPYGKVGDRLWVRERIRLIAPKGGCGWNNQYKGKFIYEADGLESGWLPYPKRLSILDCGYCVPNGCHKEAARIWLEITGVRVERVQDISVEDIWAEGVPKLNLPRTKKEDLGWYYYKLWRILWDSINAKRGFGWDKNPWVWVVEFNGTIKPTKANPEITEGQGWQK